MKISTDTAATGAARVRLRVLCCLILSFVSTLILAQPAPASEPSQQPAALRVPPVITPSSGFESRSSFTFQPPSRLGGEPDTNGFPNWQERVMHEWINRARVDPQVDLAGCGAKCPENIGGCYVARDPLIWNGAAGRAARFHSAEMGLRSFVDHPSNCTLVSNINSLYPGTCDGSAWCACVGGTSPACSPTCTSTSGRLGLFGSGYSGEIIAAGYSAVNDAFYGWLLEPSYSTVCEFNLNNGHRWLILQATSAVGTGYESVAGSTYTRYYTGDFGGSNSPIPKIPSGAHYPQQASSIDFWVNWYDSAAPQSAAVDIDGTCYSMTLGRGSSTNGAYTVTRTGLGSGCHRYYFSFVDSTGTLVTYPTTGSYGIGTTSCPDWDSSRPAACSPPVPTGTGFYTVTPCRLVDTRGADGPTGGPAIQPVGGADRSFTLTGGTCAVPSDAVAVSANVTVTQTAAGGELTVYPADQSLPGTSTISFDISRTRANNAMLLLSSADAVKVHNSSSGTVHLIIDVNGYFR